MPDHKASILIVEDEEFVRTLSQRFSRYSGIECGVQRMALPPWSRSTKRSQKFCYPTSTCRHVWSELLPLIRLQFPIVRVIAMSGAFSETRYPTEVAADGVLPRRATGGCSLKAIERLSSANRQSCEGPEPRGILRNGQDIKRAMPIQGRYPLTATLFSIPPLPIQSGPSGRELFLRARMYISFELGSE